MKGHRFFYCCAKNSNFFFNLDLLITPVRISSFGSSFEILSYFSNEFDSLDFLFGILITLYIISFVVKYFRLVTPFISITCFP